jgi:hypothetical protein
MASFRISFLLVLATLLLLSSPVSCFGAGNIASLSKIEGKNWRHGDIEDMLKTVAFLRGHKWTSMMIKRVYFGNWLRDYSQAVDVGTLKGVQAGTIRILVWVLAFMSFGYATAEFEVTDERLGTYRPEEHIDNPKDYADNEVNWHAFSYPWHGLFGKTFQISFIFLAISHVRSYCFCRNEMISLFGGCSLIL